MTSCACRKLDPYVLVIQTTKDRVAEYGANRLDGTRDRRILVQRKVRTRLIVINEVRPQQMTEVALAKDNHVINTLLPDRPDQPFRIAVLPRRPR